MNKTQVLCLGSTCPPGSGRQVTDDSELSRRWAVAWTLEGHCEAGCWGNSVGGGGLPVDSQDRGQCLLHPGAQRVYECGPGVVDHACNPSTLGG